MTSIEIRKETYNKIKNNPYIQKSELNEAAYRWLIRNNYIKIHKERDYAYKPSGKGTYKEILRVYDE